MTDHQNSPDQVPDPIPDLVGLISILFKRKMKLTIIFLFVTIIGGYAVFNLPEYYEATTSIVLEQQTLKMSDVEDFISGVEFDDMTVQTETKVLLSPDLVDQTIETLQLYNYEEFNDAKDQNDPDYVKYIVQKNFIEKLSIKSEGHSRVIKIGFKSKDPKLAALIANTHADSYLKAQIKARSDQALKISQLIEDEVNKLQETVLEKSAEVQRFREKEGLIKGRGSEELIYQQISSVAAQLVPIEVKKYSIEAKLNALHAAREKGDLDAISEVVNSGLIQNLKIQANQAERNVKALSSTYGKDHPKMRTAMKELQQTNATIKSEIENIETSLNNEAEVIHKQETLINAKLEELRLKVNKSQEQLIGLHKLELQEAASRDLLNNLLSNYEEVRSQINFAKADAKIISKASAPVKPSDPNKKLLLVVVIAISGFVAVGFVFLQEVSQTGIRNFDDIKKVSHINVVGIVPEYAKTFHAAVNKKKSSYREAIKRIYMNSLMKSNKKTILVTSASSGEGRSSFTLSMAGYLSSINHKVLVINTDFSNPRVEMDTTPGLIELLSKKITKKEAISKTEYGFSSMASGDQELYSPDLISEDVFGALLTSLKKEYDYILIDTGPVLARSDAGVVAESVDGIIFVTKWLKTKPLDLARSITDLGGTSDKIIGAVINRVKVNKYKSMNLNSDFLLPHYKG